MSGYRLPGSPAAERLAAERTIGLLELTSIARGWAVVDRMVKAATVTVVDAATAQPGKFLIVVTGGVAEIEEALAAGVAEAGTSLFDHLILTNLTPEVPAAINRELAPELGDTVAVVEGFSAASIIAAADAALKAGNVELESIVLLDGLGGKAYLVLTGGRSDIESGVAAARSAMPADMFVEASTISEFSPELAAFLPGRR